MPLSGQHLIIGTDQAYYCRFPVASWLKNRTLPPQHLTLSACPVEVISASLQTHQETLAHAQTSLVSWLQTSVLAQIHPQKPLSIWLPPECFLHTQVALPKALSIEEAQAALALQQGQYFPFATQHALILQVIPTWSWGQSAPEQQNYQVLALSQHFAHMWIKAITQVFPKMPLANVGYRPLLRLADATFDQVPVQEDQAYCEISTQGITQVIWQPEDPKLACQWGPQAYVAAQAHTDQQTWPYWGVGAQVEYHTLSSRLMDLLERAGQIGKKVHPQLRLPLRLDFRPPCYIDQQRQVRKRRFLILTALVGLCLVGLGALAGWQRWQQVQSIAQQEAALAPQIAQVQALRAQIQAYEARFALLESLPKLQVLPWLTALDKQLPQDTWLTQIILEPQGKVTLVGRSAQAEALVGILSQMPEFTKVSLSRAITREGAYASFGISIELVDWPQRDAFMETYAREP
ncbi:Fimbrial assembly protein (PilN) [Allopseudospirillum japonicum]|uniref:Fimbrial assembly protein (PilN) n=1 Tax=Allopseudospirillum japonicum TaxID=64971 RepID=A0A1H6R2N4_9GAMM|nr:PilN domain-containing protein [Allopseudospirillum japonicum]SEI46747.1 Fimbrial assembly protein (PilN) [Allopseudospirillum japonicum]